MKGKKFISIIEGALIIAVGVLVAIFGAAAIIDKYFGIVFVVSGTLTLVAEIISLVKFKRVDFLGLFAVFTLILLGICLLVPYRISFVVLVDMFVLILTAFGAALIFFGIYTAVKFNRYNGAGMIVMGLLFALFGILYLALPGFEKAFWIVIGVVIAIYGAYLMLVAIFAKENKLKAIEEK